MLFFLSSCRFPYLRLSAAVILLEFPSSSFVLFVVSKGLGKSAGARYNGRRGVPAQSQVAAGRKRISLAIRSIFHAGIT